MADLADLGIRIRSEEVAVADDRLDDFTAAATRAETATEGLGAASRTTGSQLAVMTTAVRQQNAVLNTARSAIGLTAAEGMNLGRQFTDVGVQMAMGMNPFMIAIQQGPQILDTFQMAAVRTGTTVTGAMVAAGGAIWTAMAPLLPFIAAAGAAAAVVGGTLALATRSLNQEFGDLTEGMGLTEKQLEKVQNRGVTMGDVVGGSLTYLRDIIWDKVGPAVTKIGDWFSDAMDVAGRAIVAGSKLMTGAFFGSFRAVQAVWGQLPAVMSDAAITAANATLRAMQSMVNGSVSMLNGMIIGLNLVNKTNLPTVPGVTLPQIDNPNAGAARAAGVQMGREFAAGMAEGSAVVDRQLDALRTAIRGAAEDRIRAEAGDAGANGRDRGGAEREARALREHLTRIEEIDLQPLRGAFFELVDPLKLVSDELRLIDQLAQDTARGLSSAFGESGRALGDLLVAMTGYQSRLADIDLAEKEHRLSAAQADRERSQAQIANYGDMAAAARGFFREGSDGYRIMMAIEQAYRLQQLAGMIQEMVLGKQATVQSVSDSMAKGAASSAAGAAKMFESLGPLAFPAVAAMLAVLAGLGLRGGGGGGGSPRISSAANDNGSAEASTAAVRAFSIRDAHSRDVAASAVAARVDVRVTADREGLNAYVEGKAVEAATPIAANAAMAGYAVQREERRQAMRRARQSFVR